MSKVDTLVVEKVPDLVLRLRGIYRIQVNDGSGLLNGSDVFERRFETPRIHHEAAYAIEQLVTAVQEAQRVTTRARAFSRAHHEWANDDQQGYDALIALTCDFVSDVDAALTAPPTFGEWAQKVTARPNDDSPAVIGADVPPHGLECSCCGDIGAFPASDGTFMDGQSLECGCSGMVSIGVDGPWVNNGDTPCVKCAPPTGGTQE